MSVAGLPVIAGLDRAIPCGMGAPFPREMAGSGPARTAWGPA